MLSRSLVVATLLAVASAVPCIPRVKYTLPVTGDAAQVLPPPDTGLRLLKIGIGHGLQNYSCANTGAPVASAGALAVLYDVTNLYPGTRNTGLSQDDFNGLAQKVLHSQDIPIKLQNPANNAPGTVGNEAEYGADITNPFIPAASLTLPGMAPIPFLGRHYFDINNSPTFDLSAVSLLASVGKNAGCKAPANADKGILSTGAVDWLQLKDNGKGISKGVSMVYRVITAGGASHTCADLNAATGSVPYTAFYWFYGP